MLDFENLQQYSENNRIEAKQATGGFPQSLWETYSAFANTTGGIILLGVVELPDHAFQAVELLDPEDLVEEFWRGVRDPQVVSRNILAPEDVYIARAQGRDIVVIQVPRARRQDRPVYLGGDPFRGSYRRSGEGDYRCTPEEVRGMLWDSLEEACQRVLELITRQVAICPSQAAQLLGVDPGRAERLLRGLEEKGLVEREGETGKYRLTS